MSFEAYFQFLLTHWLSEKSTDPTEQKEKRNKPSGISHTWFGLFPFSVQLFRQKYNRHTKKHYG